MGMGGPFLRMPWREEASNHGMAWRGIEESYMADRQGPRTANLDRRATCLQSAINDKVTRRYCSDRATGRCDVRCTMCNVDGIAAKEPGSQSQLTISLDVLYIHTASSPAPSFTVLSFQIFHPGSSTGDPPPGRVGRLGSRFDINNTLKKKPLDY